MGLIDYLQVFFYRIIMFVVGLFVFFIGVGIIGTSASQGRGFQPEYNMWIAIPGLILVLLGIGIMGYAVTRKQP